MTTFEQADRLKQIPPYLFVRLEKLSAEKRAAGWDMIDFGIGDPDLPTPDCIVEELCKQAGVNENQKYSSSQGEKDLRRAVAAWYKKRFGVEVDPDTQVCITIGSKEGIFNIAQAFVNAGETIVAPSPGYPVYSGAATIFNEAKCVKVPLRAEKNWLLDVDECPKGARMLYLNYPNNPTGATCDLEYLRKVYDWCQENGTILCYDAAYSEMCYDGYQAPSILQVGPDAIEFGSFSKTFNREAAPGHRRQHGDLRREEEGPGGGPQEAGLRRGHAQGHVLRLVRLRDVLGRVHPEDDRHRRHRHPGVRVRRERRGIHQDDRHRARRAHKDRAREDGTRLLRVIKQPPPGGAFPFSLTSLEPIRTSLVERLYPENLRPLTEVSLMENESFKKYVAELIGTLVLTMVGCGVAVVVGCGTSGGIVATALAFGLSVVAMAYCIGRVSGCHINPAITIGMYVDKRIGTRDAIGYIVFQFIGGIIGAALLWAILSQTDIWTAATGLGTNGFDTASAAGISMAGALLIEVLLTFIFVLAALGVTSTKATAAQGGIVIGLTLALVHLLGIGLTGTSVNPARSFGPALMMLAEDVSLPIEQVWVFIVAPIVGAIIAGLVWKFLKPADDPEDA